MMDNEKTTEKESIKVQLDNQAYMVHKFKKVLIPEAERLTAIEATLYAFDKEFMAQQIEKSRYAIEEIIRDLESCLRHQYEINNIEMKSFE